MVNILLQQEGAFPVGKRLVSEVEKVYLNIIVAIIYVGFILTKDHITDVQQYPTSAHIQQDSYGISFGVLATGGIPFGFTRWISYPFC